MKKYFRVQKGYGEDDYISIDEVELPMAMRAQITGKVAVFSEGSVSGNHIISVIPDYSRMMGWKRGYRLNGEDYDRVGKKTIDECRLMIDLTMTEVAKQLGGKQALIGN
jgi:hypothetical protein